MRAEAGFDRHIERHLTPAIRRAACRHCGLPIGEDVESCFRYEKHHAFADEAPATEAPLARMEYEPEVHYAHMDCVPDA